MCPSLLRLRGLLRPLRSSARELAKGNAAQAECFWRKAGALFCFSVQQCPKEQHESIGWMAARSRAWLEGDCPSAVQPLPFLCPFSQPCCHQHRALLPGGCTPPAPSLGGCQKPPSSAPAPQPPSTHSWKQRGPEACSVQAACSRQSSRFDWLNAPLII